MNKKATLHDAIPRDCESQPDARDLLTLFDLSSEDLNQILALARELKADLRNGDRPPRLANRVLGMVFEKQSLRTRVSFEAGMAQLGGSSIFLGADAGWGQRESVADFGNVISEYLDVLVFRGNDHAILEELAENCGCPVINGLTPDSHPCQAIADVMTVQECCGIRSKNDAPTKVAFVGDGNNVSRSLAAACAMTDMRFSIASPKNYGLDEGFLRDLRSRYPQALLEITTDPAYAVAGADAVYTDVWASMGQESEQEQRARDFDGFQVNGSLMKLANRDAIFLHCLPAKRNEEVTSEVIDGPRSAIVPQAGNRMHAQKAILVWLLEGQKGNS